MLFFHLQDIFRGGFGDTELVFEAEDSPRLPPLLFAVWISAGVCGCLRTTDWGKLVKQTRGSAGVGWGPDIVLALGWGTASQGPLYESCSP